MSDIRCDNRVFLHSVRRRFCLPRYVLYIFDHRRRGGNNALVSDQKTQGEQKRDH